jgi:hypothetical protein
VKRLFSTQSKLDPTRPLAAWNMDGVQRDIENLAALLDKGSANDPALLPLLDRLAVLLRNGEQTVRWHTC